MIAALHPCSFVDFPGRLAAVAFTQGCNLRCRYCHNPELCAPRTRTPGASPSAALLDLLAQRRGTLAGVVVTGGEPTLHDDLPDLLATIRELGFATKLDTNGTRPDVVARLAERSLLDYAAVDVKLPPGSDSAALCGTADQGTPALETLAALRAAGIPAEARTTVLADIHDRATLAATAQALTDAGVTRWRLQPVGTHRLLDPTTPGPPRDDVLADTCASARHLGIDAAVRGRRHTPPSSTSGLTPSRGPLSPR